MAYLAHEQCQEKRRWNEQEIGKTRLCVHHFRVGVRGPCRSANDGRCPFAHTLMDLKPPNEGAGICWDGVWKSGDVDHYFMPSQKFSLGSLERFQSAFLWEVQTKPQDIPNWAWGACQEELDVRAHRRP